MNHYMITYLSVNMARKTVARRALTPDTARQAFAQWQLSVGDTALAAHPQSPIVVEKYTPEYARI